MASNESYDYPTGNTGDWENEWATKYSHLTWDEYLKMKKAWENANSNLSWEEYVKEKTKRSGGPVGTVVAGGTTAWDTIKNVFLGKKGDTPVDFGPEYGPKLEIRKRNYYAVRKSESWVRG
jgi:hypothetical protein